METPVNHYEKQELEKLIEEKFERLHDEQKRLSNRLRDVEGTQKEIANMNATLQLQNQSIERIYSTLAEMVEAQKEESQRLQAIEKIDLRALDATQKEQAKRLTALETQDGEKAKKAISTIKWYLVSGAIGAAFTLAVTLISRLI
ncbi:MAG: hypothetical protein LUG23_00110 [Oscillospiraceae bacterium]|nr:hypothetical protein [Oscillospiraceae bacterium]